MTEWVPHESRDSPDRIDALVFAVTELAGRAGKMATVASPTKLPKRSTEPAIRHHLQGARR
jgi:hypothetical protein